MIQAVTINSESVGYSLDTKSIVAVMGEMKLAKAFVPEHEVCAACKILQKCVGDRSKSQRAIERKHFEYVMSPLIGKTVNKTLKSGQMIKVEFTKRGNEHIYSDAIARSSVLQLDDLKDIDRILEGAAHVDDAVRVSTKKSNPYCHFYYFKAMLHEKELYVNVGKLIVKSKS